MRLYMHTYFICSKWHIKIVHEQVQSKTYKAQEAHTSASTTNRHTQIKTVSKTFHKRSKINLRNWKLFPGTLGLRCVCCKQLLSLLLASSKTAKVIRPIIRHHRSVRYGVSGRLVGYKSSCVFVLSVCPSVYVLWKIGVGGSGWPNVRCIGWSRSPPREGAKFGGIR